MFKNPWFTMVIGLIVGLSVGYVLAERQPVPPGKALRLGAPQAASEDGLPEGHPPIGADQRASDEVRFFEQQVAEIQGLLAQSPNDVGLVVAMADANFELARATGDPNRWREARIWYERAMDDGRDRDPNVLTDLAVVFRNLQQQDRSIELLDRAIAADDGHWQAWFNKVVILNFDLHQHDAAKDAFRKLEAIAAENPDVPDLTNLENEVMGS
jgi:tetratricopeptide (TPR) repeat protein